MCRCRIRPLWLVLLLLLPLFSHASIEGKGISQRNEVKKFISSLADKHGFDANQLRKLFGEVRLKQAIIDTITRPAESKPWYEYRPIFLTESRIREGARFWNTHREDLARAEREYGVAPEIIVAILGVETRYGRYKGNYRVMDALATLAFAYPPRAKFFRSELEQYLLLAREEGLDPLSVTGSYAGAMGFAQFISSSYRHYAVDFDGDGKRDLWNNTSDAIGSIANYLKRHHWKPGEKVTVPALVGGNHIKVTVKKGYKPHSSVAELRKRGVTPKEITDPSARAALVELETRTGHEYWLGLDNFYVITRYNHSPLYAMAVYQLGQAILEQLEQNREQANG